MTATTPNLQTQYDPTATEAKWQKFWEENQVFKKDAILSGCLELTMPALRQELRECDPFGS